MRADCAWRLLPARSGACFMIFETDSYRLVACGASKDRVPNLTNALCRNPFRHPPRNSIAGKRRAHPITLRAVATGFGQRVQGFRILYSLRHDPVTKLMGKIDEGSHNDHILLGSDAILDEILVDFDLGKRQLPQLEKR